MFFSNADPDAAGEDAPLPADARRTPAPPAAAPEQENHQPAAGENAHVLSDLAAPGAKAVPIAAPTALGPPLPIAVASPTKEKGASTVVRISLLERTVQEGAKLQEEQQTTIDKLVAELAGVKAALESVVSDAQQIHATSATSATQDSALANTRRLVETLLHDKNQRSNMASLVIHQSEEKIYDYVPTNSQPARTLETLRRLITDAGSMEHGRANAASAKLANDTPVALSTGSRHYGCNFEGT